MTKIKAYYTQTRMRKHTQTRTYTYIYIYIKEDFERQKIV